MILCVYDWFYLSNILVLNRTKDFGYISVIIIPKAAITEECGKKCVILETPERQQNLLDTDFYTTIIIFQGVKHSHVSNIQLQGQKTIHFHLKGCLS